MKILIVSTSSDFSGAPIHIVNLVKGIKSLEFRLLCGGEGLVFSENNIPFTRISSLKSNLNLFRDIVTLFALIKNIIKYKPDLIHSHSSKAAMLSRIAGTLFNLPVIYTVHGWGWRGFGRIKSNLIKLIEYILSFSNCFYIFVGKCLLDEINFSKKISNRYKVIFNSSNSVQNTKKKSYGRSLKILMPARVDRSKDHQLLAKAFEKINFDSKLIFCGKDTNSKKFKNQIHEIAPNKYKDIEFLGEVFDMHSLYVQADIFCLISNYEALPISIIEAMSYGLPIIASDVGCNKEILTDEYSFMIKKGDLSELKDKLELLLVSSAKRNEFGLSSNEAFLKKFTLEKMCRETFLTYQEILIRKNR